MPFEIRKVKGGWKVVSADTGKAHSKKPLSKKNAEAQRSAIVTNYYRKG